MKNTYRTPIRIIAGDVLRHTVLAVLACIWLVPIVWMITTSLSVYQGRNILRFFPNEWTFSNFIRLFSDTDTVSNFPAWFTNTFIVACFTCVISSIFVLMIAYTMSFFRFHGRIVLMNVGVLLGLFPGFLTMICLYYLLKEMQLTDTLTGLILVYSGSSGLGYLIAKGFFDTIPRQMVEAAKVEGASEITVFMKIILPLSRPIIVYTVISSFLIPWMDFIFANIIIKSRISDDWTVAVGLFNMLNRTNVNNYFSRFCAGGVLVSIPISILFVIMQKFYVESVAGGSVKG
ncbi:MAG: ABC transporter permease subunit [Anaerolineales bacterium]|nr:ABC transporter permease subunit [Anaerolineales bacterium]